jgi:hypothetical protein
MFDLRMVGEPQDIVRRKGGRVEINLMQPMAGKRKVECVVCIVSSYVRMQVRG